MLRKNISFRLIAIIFLLGVVFSKWQITIQPNKSIKITNPFYFKFSEKCKFDFKGEGNIELSSDSEFSINDITTKSKIIEKTLLRKSHKIGLENSIDIKNNSTDEVIIKCSMKNSKKILKENLKEINNLKISYDFDFAPGKPDVFENPLFLGVNAKCSVTSPDVTQSLIGKLQKGTAKINGQTIPNEGITVQVKNGDSFKIYAGAYAKAELTNLGTVNIHASCGLAKEDIEKAKEEILSLLKMINQTENYLNTISIGAKNNLKYLSEDS